MAKVKTRRGVGGSRRSHVEVLLTEDVANLGNAGDIVRVKPGFARNFLLPQGLATVATEQNKKMVEVHRVRLEEAEKDRIKSIRTQADAISKYSVTLEANANEEGHLYGSIVAVDISKALKQANFPVEPDHIKLDGPLRELGMYTVKIEMHEKVKTDVKVWVVPSAKGEK
ncbi:50S ribosomal protein L9 [Stratiformator vulcanicus]|uniref:Large ribosomal subunit protein bL9 n=1 Tax=Stratiformator vulcanicus TaxID=2527980 RepID=A0A517R6G7_9PLAN|nr:50S ribosomal protein L9 [Stratiformator vulcanicus]QDT39432.1 50S ribosomal protein L9 [Stratiformator vulcanicus]